MDNSGLEVMYILLSWYLWIATIQGKKSVERCFRITLEDRRCLVNAGMEQLEV